MSSNESSIRKSTGCGIEVKDLTYQPASAGSPILSDISYAFFEGHMTALLGPNGSGKTAPRPKTGSVK